MSIESMDVYRPPKLRTGDGHDARNRELLSIFLYYNSAERCPIIATILCNHTLQPRALTQSIGTNSANSYPGAIAVLVTHH